jgi:hypothetical protein
VLAELARKRFNRPHPTAVSGPLDEIRQAFVERTLDVSMHAASKVSLVAAFAKITPDKSPGPDTKAKKAAADKRKAAIGAAAAANTGTEPNDGTKPSTKK